MRLSSLLGLGPPSPHVVDAESEKFRIRTYRNLNESSDIKSALFTTFLIRVPFLQLECGG